MTTERIDVLTTMDAACELLEDEGFTNTPAALEEARAAVAELIEATKLLVAESVHPYDGGEYEDGEWKVLDRARAALARVGGAS